MQVVGNKSVATTLLANPAPNENITSPAIPTSTIHLFPTSSFSSNLELNSGKNLLVLVLNNWILPVTIRVVMREDVEGFFRFVITD